MLKPKLGLWTRAVTLLLTRALFEVGCVLLLYDENNTAPVSQLPSHPAAPTTTAAVAVTVTSRLTMLPAGGTFTGGWGWGTLRGAQSS